MDRDLEASELTLYNQASARLVAAGFRFIEIAHVIKRDWWSVIALAAVGHYWEGFDALQPLMTDSEYATTVREIFCNTNGLSPVSAHQRLVAHGRSITQRMWMTIADWDAFQNLPQEIQVFRGCHLGEEEGVSWTLTREVAEHFAIGLRDESREVPFVLAGVVAKKDIFALFSANWEEAEVIVLGGRVRINERTKCRLL